MIPGLRLPAIYDLVAQLRDDRHHRPVVTVLGLWLCWEPLGERGGVVTVFDNDDPTEAPPRCTIHEGGRFEGSARCDSATVTSLRNLAADPRRWLRREGQESGFCPFCRRDIGDCDLASMIGYCESCASRLGWPHGQHAALRAEDALRAEIQAEQENGEHLRSTDAGHGSIV